MFSKIGRTFPSRRRALVLDVFWPPQLHDDCQALGDSRAQAIPLFVQHFLAIFGFWAVWWTFYPGSKNQKTPSCSCEAGLSQLYPCVFQVPPFECPLQYHLLLELLALVHSQYTEMHLFHRLSTHWWRTRRKRQAVQLINSDSCMPNFIKHEEKAILISGQKFYANICKKEFAHICFNPKIEQIIAQKFARIFF